MRTAILGATGVAVAVSVAVVLAWYAVAPPAPTAATNGPTASITSASPSAVPGPKSSSPTMSTLERIETATIEGFITRLRTTAPDPRARLSATEFVRATADMPFFDYANTVRVAPRTSASQRLSELGYTSSDSVELQRIRRSLPNNPGPYVDVRLVQSAFVAPHTIRVGWLERRVDGSGAAGPPATLSADVTFRVDPRWIAVDGVKTQSAFGPPTGNAARDQILAAIALRYAQDPTGIVVTSVTPVGRS